MAKRVKVPLSSGRAKLFELAEMVRSGDNTVVVFEHRGSTEKVALVRESRLTYLEARIAELEKSVKKTGSMRGSLTTDLTEDQLDELLRDIRRGWNRKVPLTLE